MTADQTEPRTTTIETGPEVELSIEAQGRLGKAFELMDRVDIALRLSGLKGIAGVMQIDKNGAFWLTERINRVGEENAIFISGGNPEPLFDNPRHELNVSINEFADPEKIVIGTGASSLNDISTTFDIDDILMQTEQMINHLGFPTVEYEELIDPEIDFNATH